MNKQDAINKLYEIEEKISRNLQLDKYDKEAITFARQTLEKPSCICLKEVNYFEIFDDDNKLQLRIFLDDTEKEE